ncbi:MAG: hypothetical protein A2018_02545 [Alphaproteobacteria bacterium GWF2_58_20]|nr:MAG: hypothetical protein A2018_02545 [Alphaproteobacteria bacterium GWF2_58_20]
MALRIASVLPSRKQLLKFAFTPQLSGNFRGLSRVFLALVQTLAHVLVTSRLIEPTHPVFMGQLGGLEGLGRIMVDAGAKLEWKRKALPQILIYFSVALLLAMMVAMVVISISQLFISVAMAQTAAADAGILTATNDKARDWLLCIFPTNASTPCPASVEGGAQLEQLAKAIAAMLAYYSTGCMVLAGIIVGYEVTAIVVETAKEGVLFGRRHNELWAPIRLVFAIALLTPLPNGFNSGQIAVVKFATWGSGFASNVWGEFVTKTSNADFLTNTTMATMGLDATVEDAIEKLLVAETVRQAVYVEATVNQSGGTISVGQVTTPWMGGVTQTTSKWLGLSSSENEVSYKQMLDTTIVNLPLPNSSDPSKYDTKLAMKVVFPSVGSVDTKWLDSQDIQNISSLSIKSSTTHKTALLNILQDVKFRQIALEIAKNSLGNAAFNPQTVTSIVSADRFWEQVATYRKFWKTSMASELQRYQMATSQSKNARYMTEWGWVGAGGWILQLSQRIQAIKSAVQVKPDYQLLVSLDALTDVNASVKEQALAKAAWRASAWLKAAANTVPSDTLSTQLGAEIMAVQSDAATSDPIAEKFKNADMMTYLFTYLPQSLGESGNPLVALIDFGWVILGVAGTILAAAAVIGADGFWGGIMFTAFVPVFTSGVIVAILFPLLPTLRFAFGMMSWVLAILEAVFAVPVVALAHLRTDGAGLMGPMAQSAYMLMLQIFVRPSLMVMGLIGGLLVFSVTLHIVNLLFLVALTGYPSKWGGYYILGFASIFIYASMVITMANMCFKMIDMVPDTILRWIGGGGMAGVHDVSFVRGTMLTAAGTSAAVVKAHRDVKVAQKGEMKARADRKGAENKETFMEFYTKTHGDPETGKMPVTPEEYKVAREKWGTLFEETEMEKNKKPEERKNNLAKTMARLSGLKKTGAAAQLEGSVAPGESPLKGKGPEERTLLEERSEGGSKITDRPKTKAETEE